MVKHGSQRSVVAAFGVEDFEGGVAEAVAADEVNDKEHEEGAADHDGDGDLQAELQIAKVGDPSNYLRTEPADQLRGEHVDADGGGVGAAGHHVVENGGDRTVVPRHEKAGDKKAQEHSFFFFRLDGEQQARRGK